MNRKSIILSAWLLTSAFHAFAQQEVPQESTFLNPERVTIKDGRDSMNITIKGRQGEPDFTFSRTVMYPSDEVTVTRERRTHPDFSIPFGFNSVKDKEEAFEMKGTRTFIVNGFECVVHRSSDDDINISRKLTSYLANKADSVLHIPAFIEYEGKRYNVSGISKKGFAGNTDIKHLIIDEGVWDIGDEAFICCTNLQSVRIPATAEYFGLNAFGSCPNLKSIIVDSANKEFDSRDNCNAIIETKSNTLAVGCGESSIPSSVTTIRQGAFANCLNMESITIPEGVKQIEDEAFAGCYHLKSISLPQSLEYLGMYVFWNCTSLPSIVIPKNVKEIKHGGLFQGCNQLKSLTVEEGNGRYDSRSACNAIVETATNTLVTACAGTRIVEGIGAIGEEAFTGMPIHSLHLPKTVSKIENYAFYNCEELVSITVDEENPVYSSPAGSNALLTKDGKTLVLGCAGTVFPEGITHIGEGAFWGNRVPMGALSLPEGIKVIGERAFSHCPNLWMLTIPSSVDSIGEYAFSYCPKLNIACLKGGGKMLAYGIFYRCEKLVAIELPQGMESISNIAFSHCTNLYSIGLPSSLQEVGRNAFKDCPCEKEVLQLVQKNKE